jgi:hypothetical protein
MAWNRDSFTFLRESEQGVVGKWILNYKELNEHFFTTTKVCRKREKPGVSSRPLEASKQNPSSTYAF